MKPQASSEEILQTLTAAAIATFGPERAEAQRAALEGAAVAIARVLKEPLDLTDAEPDFVHPGR